MVDSVNASLRFAMENYWQFSEVANYMPISEAKEFIKKNKEYCYITIDEGVSRSLSRNGPLIIKGIEYSKYRYISYSERLSIYSPKLTASVYLPEYQGWMNKTTTVYAAMQLSKILDLLYEEKFKNLLGSGAYIKRNGPKIVNKTLLIPREYVSPKLSEVEIREAYPHPLELCDLEKIERAILNKDPKYAVVFHVPIPAGGKYLYRLYITNAEDGDIYGVADGNRVELDLGYISVGGQNKKYLINKKELKQIGSIAD
jgi:hypothetical protein